MRSRKWTVGFVVSVVASLAISPLAAGGASGAVQPSAAVSPTAERAAPAPVRWVPPDGVLFNDPVHARRVIANQVRKSVYKTREGQTIRLMTWNFDSRGLADLLIDEMRNGVNVQVIVAGSVDSPSWYRLQDKLGGYRKRGPLDQSFAVRCRGGCRSYSKIMHMKIFLFSKVNAQEHISMFGSANLTGAAAAHQWNDLVTTYNPEVYEYFTKIFDKSAPDEPRRGAYDHQVFGDHEITMFPMGDRPNPVVKALRPVQCLGRAGGGRTVVRIAVAGWFDSFGEAIARQVRSLWDRGCDVRIVTTLAGRGVHRTLQAGYGRGPVPMRNLAPDRNGDGIPERYLHMKSVGIRGVYGLDRDASVIITGSPNWSTRAARSEEELVQINGHPRWTGRYIQHIEGLFRSPSSSARNMTPAELRQAFRVQARTTGSGDGVPDWIELD